MPVYDQITVRLVLGAALSLLLLLPRLLLGEDRDLPLLRPLPTVEAAAFYLCFLLTATAALLPIQPFASTIEFYVWAGVSLLLVGLEWLFASLRREFGIRTLLLALLPPLLFLLFGVCTRHSLLTAAAAALGGLRLYPLVIRESEP
jgi:hypothetical protein